MRPKSSWIQSTQLPQRFVSHNTDGGREIERTQSVVLVRNGQPLTSQFGVEPVGRTVTFATKDETVAIRVFDIPIRMFGLGAK